MSRNRWDRPALLILGGVLVLLPAIFLVSCGGVNNAPSNTPPPPPVPLTAAEVQQVVEDAAKSLNVPMVIAVSDRAGTILAVFQNAGAPATSTGNFGVAVDGKELAVALPRTPPSFTNTHPPLSTPPLPFFTLT